MALSLAATSAESAAKRRRPPAKAVPAPAAPVDSYAAERAEIAAWRDRLLSSGFAPERTLVILADGTMPRFGQKACDKDAAPATVALEIRPKGGKGRPGEDHRMIGYRGESGAWCMAAGVGVITFADGSRWLGQVSTAGAAGGGRNFLPRPDGLGEMIAQDGIRTPQKVAARADILWGFDVREALPPAPGAVQALAAGAPRPPPPGPVAKAPEQASEKASVKPATRLAESAPTAAPAGPPSATRASVGLLSGFAAAKPGSAPAATQGRPAVASIFGLVAGGASPRPASAPPVTPVRLTTPPPAIRVSPTMAAAKTAMAKPRQAFDVIEGTSGLYMSPFTSDGVTAAWITKSMQVKAAGQIGSMAGNYLGQKAMEQVPFVGGFLGKKAGQAVGRQVALSAIGGDAFLRSSTDLSFNSAEALVGWTLANYGSRDDIAQVMQAVIAIYPDVQTPYLVAAQQMRKKP
ncbi:hypothetical protein JKL49_07245 [Phenylobacterium sp. 20VBR1]|uniref:Uncharacterized protein n=2 Tax=Phenylobacterium glaciei TaxID=2803784 RepID=A0A941CZJ5_9CAUL|nr:hypothetical protein [Phenylobacterium glaciei]MBR7619182.1 hypothetical protein [Phenylobacterium glaciei]